jgi:hypothetical protein
MVIRLVSINRWLRITLPAVTLWRTSGRHRLLSALFRTWSHRSHRTNTTGSIWEENVYITEVHVIRIVETRWSVIFNLCLYLYYTCLRKRTLAFVVCIQSVFLWCNNDFYLYDLLNKKLNYYVSINICLLILDSRTWFFFSPFLSLLLLPYSCLFIFASFISFVTWENYWKTSQTECLVQIILHLKGFIYWQTYLCAWETLSGLHGLLQTKISSSCGNPMLPKHDTEHKEQKQGPAALNKTPKTPPRYISY